MIRLGINIDHVATLRNARGGAHPDPIAAAHLAVKAGADGITAHLREDRRHMRDVDMQRLKSELSVPLNFEMAATDEMIAIASALRPHAACLVPERREEVTTEGGLDVESLSSSLIRQVAQLSASGVRVSLFIDPDISQIEAAARVGAPVVELHTGAYAESLTESAVTRLKDAACLAASLGLEVHAGHGLTVDNVRPVAKIAQLRELNIGHALVGDSIFMGLDAAVKRMRAAISEARFTV